jgi:hypothetical protein
VLSVDLAIELRRAGLAWQPAERDCFAIPGEQFEGQVFSLNQLPTLIEFLRGHPAITFHGSSEWALDYLLTSEAVWLPSETQLREKLATLLGPDAPLALERASGGYRCRAGAHIAEHATAEDAYGQALLAILRERNGPPLEA